jgi:polyphosphate kinase 2 (PPK2 family)
MKIDSNDFRPREGKAIHLDKWPTIVPPLFESQGEYEAVLKQHVEDLSARQQLHYASARYAVLLILQGLDAAGKDGTTQHVMSGVNPEGSEVFSFRSPSEEELKHDFLWRTTCRLPERGRTPAATSKSPTRDRVKIPHLAAAGRGMITRCDASWQDVPQIL